MELALCVVGGVLVGCLLMAAFGSVVNAASRTDDTTPTADPEGADAASPAVETASVPVAPVEPLTPPRRRTAEDQVAGTILRACCDPQLVDRVLARADELQIEGATLWLWTHVHGVTGLVLALEAGLGHEAMCAHLDDGTEPDWTELSVLAALATDDLPGGIRTAELLDLPPVTCADQLVLPADLHSWETEAAYELGTGTDPEADLDLSRFDRLPPIAAPGFVPFPSHAEALDGDELG